MGFTRQEHWSGLPFPSPGNLPDPGIEPTSAALAGRFFTTELSDIIINPMTTTMPDWHHGDVLTEEAI